MSLITELKRRNVFRVAAAYLVVGWLATEVASTLLGTFGAPDWVARALVIVIVIGFVPVVVFSWVYELTPEGIKKEREVQRDTSITAQTGRKLDVITIAAVVIGIAFLGMTRYMGPPEAPAPAAETSAQSGTEGVADPDGDSEYAEEVTVTADEASVAVLPFVNMSGNEENEYFSDGLTETLLHMLAQIPELKVAARTSSFAFKGQNQDIRTIAEELNVAHVLEGSVQRAGDRVRITAQLIHADDGFHVWSETYDRTLTDIFAIQDEIANEVGTALSASLLGDDEEISIVSIDTENIAAYEAYLEALHHKAVGSYGALVEAQRLLKQALSRDPDFNDAKVELAGIYMSSANTGLMTPEQAIEQASALLEQSIEARPGDLKARAYLHWTNATRDANAGRSSAFFELIPLLSDIVERAPGMVEQRLWLANSFSTFNQPDEAFSHLEKALEYDALNPQVWSFFGLAYLRVDRFDDAITALERSLELKPDQPNALANIGDALSGQGDYVGSVDSYIRASDADPQDHELSAIIAEAIYFLGMIEEGDSYLRRAQAIAPRSPATRRVEVARAWHAGDYDTAYLIAQEMLADDVANRQSAFTFAVSVLARVGMERGEAQEVYDFLDEQFPGIHSGSADVSLKVRFSRGGLFDLWRAVKSHDELVAILEKIVETNQELGFGPAETTRLHMAMNVASGDIDQAIETGLEHEFTEPLSELWDWRYEYTQDWYADIVQDPRVVAELQRLEREEEQVRVEMTEYLANR